EKKIIQALNYKIDKVVGCLITHSHKDHCKSIMPMRGKGIDIYLSQGTKEEIGIDDYRVNILRHGESKNIGEFTIVPFNTQHDTSEPLGFLIYHKELGKIIFATDTYYLKSKFKNVDHILVECNYSEDVLPQLPPWRARTIKSHMSLENLKETLQTWDLEGTKDITLIHISHDNGNPDRFQKEIEELTGITTYAAVPGLEIK
ncbi:MAG: MBL fold metallo-hydrolase, partial [Clostridium sp.]|uniref:MBL fold metallo-hydrolase n=1 Tax=Clostridium sp. TaxID=1506 RepID=UPI0025B9202C